MIDESVEGKRVIDTEGEAVGVATGVRAGTVFVEPEPGITETLMSRFGWAGVDADDHPLPEESIERITNDEIHLRRDF